MNGSSEETSRDERFAAALLRLSSLRLEAGADDLMQLLADSCVDLLGVDVSTVLLAGADGRLRLAGTAVRHAALADVVAALEDPSAGPCLDAYRSGRATTWTDRPGEQTPWPEFAGYVRALGVRSVGCVALRRDGTSIGALSMMRASSSPIAGSDVVVAEALGAAAMTAILNQKIVESTAARAQQLQDALESRVVIEQAKGVAAQRLGVDVDTAFDRLRSYARRTNQRIHAVAEAVVGGDADWRAIGRDGRQPPQP